jgi:hypothetical protein
MARYLVETGHTDRECLWALKQSLRDGPEYVSRFEWGCKDGEHRGWAIVEAEHKFAAQALVPQLLRPYTRIIELNQFSQAEAAAYHEVPQRDRWHALASTSRCLSAYGA